VYTAFARDVVRGCPPAWVRSLYRFAIVPHQAIFFRVALDVALRRILIGRPKLKHYEAGMDLGLHPDIQESYKMFQARILDEYEQIAQEYELTVIDATQPVEVQQRQLRRSIKPQLPKLRRARRASGAV
jgi:dTMP kinase